MSTITKKTFKKKTSDIQLAIFSFQPLNKQSKTSASLEDLLAQTSLLPNSQNGDRNATSIDRRALSKTPSKSSCQEISLDIEDNRSRLIDGTYRSLKEDSVNATPSSYSGESFEFSRARSSDSEGATAVTRPFKKRVNILTNDLPSKEKLCSSSISFENCRNLDSRNASLTNITSESDRAKADNYLTMTGTIKRGRKKGQSVDLQLNMSRDELEKINQAALLIQQAHELEQGRSNCCCGCGCSLTSGMHIFLLSLISLPFVIIVTSIYAFYIGTLTWYNMFTYFNEEKSCLYRFIMSPLLVVAYPFGIVLCTIGLGVYSGLVQISTTFAKWTNEIADIEKGFYGWLCSFLHLSDCSPYEVVILTDLKMPSEAVLGNTSTEELSL